MCRWAAIGALALGVFLALPGASRADDACLGVFAGGCDPLCAALGCAGATCESGCTLCAPGTPPGLPVDCDCYDCACAPDAPVCNDICPFVQAGHLEERFCADGTTCGCAPADADGDADVPDAGRPDGWGCFTRDTDSCLIACRDMGCESECGGDIACEETAVCPESSTSWACTCTACDCTPGSAACRQVCAADGPGRQANTCAPGTDCGCAPDASSGGGCEVGAPAGGLVGLVGCCVIVLALVARRSHAPGRNRSRLRPPPEPRA
jgi:hypothetical protein